MINISSHGTSYTNLLIFVNYSGYSWQWRLKHVMKLNLTGIQCEHYLLQKTNSVLGSEQLGKNYWSVPSKIYFTVFGSLNHPFFS